jgi:hypothetical protein
VITIYGDGIGGLVLADLLTRHGVTCNIASHRSQESWQLGDVSIEGRQLPLGPRIFELSYDDRLDIVPALSAYTPSPSGHRPYMRLIEDYIRQVLDTDLRQDVHLGTLADGEVFGDFVFSARPEQLPPLLTSSERARALRDLESRCREVGKDAYSLEWAATIRTDPACGYETMSRAFHGDLLTDRLFLPLAAKASQQPPNTIEAAYARRLWLPYFLPGTLRDVFAGSDEFRRQHRRFAWTPGGFSQFGRRVLEQLGARPHLFTFDEFDEHELSALLESQAGSDRLVLATPPALVGMGRPQAARARHAFVWFSLAAEESPHALDGAGVVTSVSRTDRFFRLSWSLADDGDVIACVESVCGEGLDVDEARRWCAEVLRVPSRYLHYLGSHVADTVAYPTAAARRDWDKYLAGVTGRFPRAFRIGGLSAYAADSINESIGTALTIADAILGPSAQLLEAETRSPDQDKRSKHE